MLKNADLRLETSYAQPCRGFRVPCQHIASLATADAGWLFLTPRARIGSVEAGLQPARGTRVSGGSSPHRSAVRTSPFHGGNTGSSPVGDTNQFSKLADAPYFLELILADAVVTVEPKLTSFSGFLRRLTFWAAAW